MEYSRRIRDVAPILTIGILGVLVSAFAWYLLFTTENRAFVQEFDSRAHNHATILQSGINDYWDKLYAVKALTLTSMERRTVAVNQIVAGMS